MRSQCTLFLARARAAAMSTAALCTLLTVAQVCEAHQQWLAPNFFLHEGDSAWLTFDHTFGDQRFQPGSGPGTYFRWWIVDVNGQRQTIPSLFVGRTRTVGEVELVARGTYRLEGVEDNMAWTLLKIDGEERWAPGSRDDFGGQEIVRSRRYFQKAMAYVTLGDISGAAVAATGEPLEIVFVDHPNALTVGEFTLGVMSYGAPLAGQKVSVFDAHTSGHDAAWSCTTDEMGRCSIEASAPGRLLISTSTRTDSAEDSSVDGTTRSVTVMVMVQPSTPEVATRTTDP